MPHDKNGEPLKVGDKVSVECEITSISEGEYCTTTLKTCEVMPGSGEPTTIGAINAKQLLKLALVLVALFLCAGDAHAFGKRGKGLFGWREGGSCGSAATASATTAAQGADSCPSGACTPSPGFYPSGAAFGPQTAVSGASVKRWVNEQGVEMICDANGCRPAGARAAPVAGVNCPCVAANGYCPCASAMNAKVTAAEPPKSITAYGRTYTLQP